MGSGRYASGVDGELIGFTDMDEWGNIIEKTIPSFGTKQADILNNFTNHEFDDVLGVYYAKARFYDPVYRRFLAVDPVNGSTLDPQTLNQYSYTLNNPVNFIDPNGRATLSDVKDAALGEAAALFDMALPLMISAVTLYAGRTSLNLGIGLVTSLLIAGAVAGGLQVAFYPLLNSTEKIAEQLKYYGCVQDEGLFDAARLAVNAIGALTSLIIAASLINTTMNVSGGGAASIAMSIVLDSAIVGAIAVAAGAINAVNGLMADGYQNIRCSKPYKCSSSGNNIGSTKKYVPKTGDWRATGQTKGEYLKNNSYTTEFVRQEADNTRIFNLYDKNGNLIGNLHQNASVSLQVIFFESHQTQQQCALQGLVVV